MRNLNEIFRKDLPYDNVKSLGLKRQKQPREVYGKKRCSYKFCKILRKSAVPESFLRTPLATSSEKRLQHRCFHVNIEKLFRTPILENISEQLLLKCIVFIYLIC